MAGGAADKLQALSQAMESGVLPPNPEAAAQAAMALTQQFIQGATPPATPMSFPPKPAEIIANVMQQVLQDLAQTLQDG